MDEFDQLELELRRLADDLAVLRAVLILITKTILPPPKEPQAAAA